MSRSKRITESQIKLTATWLRLLYETCSSYPTKLSLRSEAKQAEIPYFSIIGTILVQKGMLEKSKMCYYKWSTIEPSIHMANAVLEECRSYSLSHTIDRSPKFVTLDLTKKENNKKQKGTESLHIVLEESNFSSELAIISALCGHKNHYTVLNNHVLVSTQGIKKLSHAKELLSRII